MTRRSDWLIGQLPMGMLDDDFFVRFVSLFQEVATTMLEGADNVPNMMDVTVAPLPVVRWLGSWIGMESIDSSLPDDLQRRLVRQASRTLAWRGTRRGLEDFLEVVTGAPAEVEESGGILREGESEGRAPYACMRVQSTGWLPDADFVALVADEIPANVHYELFAGGRQLWPPTAGSTALAPYSDPGALPAGPIPEGLGSAGPGRPGPGQPSPSPGPGPGPGSLGAGPADLGGGRAGPAGDPYSPGPGEPTGQGFGAGGEEPQP